MNSTQLQTLTTLFGLIYLLVGVLGFIPGVTMPTHRDHPMHGEGLLLGIFAVNTLHNTAHLLLGGVLVWGGTQATRAARINPIMGWVFIVLFVGSFIAPIVEGVNLNPADSVLHLLSSLFAFFLGMQGARTQAASRAR